MYRVRYGSKYSLAFGFTIYAAESKHVFVVDAKYCRSSCRSSKGRSVWGQNPTSFLHRKPAGLVSTNGLNGFEVILRCHGRPRDASHSRWDPRGLAQDLPLNLLGFPSYEAPRIFWDGETNLPFGKWQKSQGEMSGLQSFPHFPCNFF